MFCFCTGLAPGSDRLAPKARLGARAQPRRGACRARAAKSARRGAVHKPVQNAVRVSRDTAGSTLVAPGAGGFRTGKTLKSMGDFNFLRCTKRSLESWAGKIFGEPSILCTTKAGPSVPIRYTLHRMYTYT